MRGLFFYFENLIKTVKNKEHEVKNRSNLSVVRIFELKCDEVIVRFIKFLL